MRERTTAKDWYYIGLATIIVMLYLFVSEMDYQDCIAGMIPC